MINSCISNKNQKEAKNGKRRNKNMNMQNKLLEISNKVINPLELDHSENRWMRRKLNQQIRDILIIKFNVQLSGIKI